MKYLVFAASLRKDSVNKKLVNLTANLLQKQGHELDRAEFSEFSMPLYNADIQEEQGFPQATLHFVERMQAAQAIIIASPEYNFSTPGTLKNLIDWVSRINPMPWEGKKILLLSASPSLVGGNRGLWATRVPLESCGAIVYPIMYSLSSAYEAFNNEGGLKDPALQSRLDNTLKRFSDFCFLLK